MTLDETLVLKQTIEKRLEQAFNNGAREFETMTGLKVVGVSINAIPSQETTPQEPASLGQPLPVVVTLNATTPDIASTLSSERRTSTQTRESGKTTSYCRHCGAACIKEWTGRYRPETGEKLHHLVCSQHPCEHDGHRWVPVKSEGFFHSVMQEFNIRPSLRCTRCG